MKAKLLLMIAVGLALAACRPYQFKGASLEEPPLAPEFTLTRPDGGRLRLSDLRGQIVLLFFGFTSCPDVCPTTLTDAKRILVGLGDQGDQVDFLFVTVDPERDTPEVLGKYVAAFHPAIIGLTGSSEELQSVWQDYGIVVEKELLENSALGYTVAHTARVMLVDADGRLRLNYAFGTPYQDILEDVRYLLNRE